MLGYINTREDARENFVEISGYFVDLAGKMSIRSKRESGAVDEWNVRGNELQNFDGRYVCIRGEIRQYRDAERHTHMYIYATEVQECDKSLKVNQFEVSGKVCGTPKHRKTPKGTEIADFVLINASTEHRPYFLNCIAWGTNARRVAILHSNNEVTITGRMQSRVYKQDKVAYELSVNKISVQSDL